MSDPQKVENNWTHRPWLGVCAVLFGAMVASFAGRLMSVGLADLRAGMALGVDEAAWIGSTFNAAMMFIGPFSVYLGAILGARRVLLFCAAVFTMCSLVLPASGHGPFFFTVLVVAGLSAGTFYPLTLSFILRNLPPKFVLLGIAMYAMDIVFTTYIATSVEAWYMDHLSWHWIFWNSTILTPLMAILVTFGIPPQPIPKPKPGQPRPSWRGFLYSSLGFALLYLALDQGQRLDWFNSGLIVALTATGGFLLLCMLVRRIVSPNPFINLRFLGQWNVVLLGIVLVSFRFVMLAAVLVIPNFLSTVQGYKALQTGSTMLWIALPQIAFGFFAMWLLRRVDVRLILSIGFTVVGLTCVLCSKVSAVWYGGSFYLPLVAFAFGFAFAFNGLVAASVLQAFNLGVMEKPVEALTYSGYFQTLRLFGGEVGTALLLHFIPVREQFHSNRLVDVANAGNGVALQRFSLLRAGMSLHTDTTQATDRAATLLGLQIRQQAFTLSIADAFQLLAWVALGVLIVVALMRPARIQYRQILTEPQP